MLDDETWFNAQEAKDNKFINDVKSKVLIQNVAVAEHDSMKLYASFTNPINNNKIISALGMSFGSTESEIISKIKSYRQSEPTAEQIQKAKDLVFEANQQKKITADLIPYYNALAEKNYDDVNNLFNKIPKLKPASEKIIESSVDGGDRSKWTLEDYRLKDPKALNNKTLFNQLLNNIK